MIKLINNVKGLTLVEVLMTLVLITLVIAIITTMVIQAYNVFETSTSRMSSGQLVEMTLKDLSGYLRASTPIEVGYEENFDNNNQEWEFKSYYPNLENDTLYWFKIRGYNGKYIYEVFEIDGGEPSNEAEISRDLPEVINKINIDPSNLNIEIEYVDSEGSLAIKSTSVRSRNL